MPSSSTPAGAWEVDKRLIVLKKTLAEGIWLTHTFRSDALCMSAMNYVSDDQCEPHQEGMHPANHPRQGNKALFVSNQSRISSATNNRYEMYNENKTTHGKAPAC